MSKYIIIAVCALGFGYLHYKYVTNIFENFLNFSHLSDLEREMALRTEMGFYYSYYKTIVEEQPFVAGITKLMYDKVVEYPKEVNAINRFNIHPEVIIGLLYRYLEPILNDTSKRDCHIVDRGNGHSLVESCTHLGQPILFYLEAIWWLAGLTVSVLFLHAVTLSDSILGGVISVLHYFTNHSECTRVQWAPNERENMAMPLLLLQGWLLTLQLRDSNRKSAIQLQISIFILNCLCLLFWQFTQFIFLTQTAIFFLMEQLRIIDIKTFTIFLHSHFCGLHTAVLLLQGNDMLKTSLYTSYFLVVSMYCLFFSSFRIKVQNRLHLLLESVFIVLRMVIAFALSLIIKKAISDFLSVQEDSHIWDILYSKFTPFKSFHTLIYTCSDVFDFLPWSTIRVLLVSFLLPVSIFNMCSYINSVIENAAATLSELAPPSNETQNQSESTVSLLSSDDKNAKNCSDTVADVDNEPTDIADDSKTTIIPEENLNSHSTTSNDSPIVRNRFRSKTIEENRCEKPTTVDKTPKSSSSEPTTEEGSCTELTTSKSEKPVPKTFSDDPLLRFLQCLDPEPAVFYSLLQMIAFSVMADLVMRLKLLSTTQMCLISSLLTKKSNYPLSDKYKKYVPLFIGLFIAPTLRALNTNVYEELSYVGEFSDYPQEELLQWINKEAGSGAFAASMPMSASVMLSTRKPIVVHPHYEHLDTRNVLKLSWSRIPYLNHVKNGFTHSARHLTSKLHLIQKLIVSEFQGLDNRNTGIDFTHAHLAKRAYTVYKMYGRFTPLALYQELNKLEASYLIVESKYCYGRSNKGCSFADIWDVEEPLLFSRPQLCHILLTEQVEHFYLLFKNSEYAVFRIHDVSVSYMPRSFDT